MTLQRIERDKFFRDVRCDPLRYGSVVGDLAMSVDCRKIEKSIPTEKPSFFPAASMSLELSGKRTAMYDIPCLSAGQ